MSDDKIKDALRMMPYGFYAFTTKNGDDVNAMVVNWVSQMSYAPRLLAVGIQKSCYSRGLLAVGGAFGLNLFLQADSDAIMGVTSGRAKKPEKMEAADYSAAPESGVPGIGRMRRLYRMPGDANCRCWRRPRYRRRRSDQR